MRRMMCSLAAAAAVAGLALLALPGLAAAQCACCQGGACVCGPGCRCVTPALFRGETVEKDGHTWMKHSANVIYRLPGPGEKANFVLMPDGSLVPLTAGGVVASGRPAGCPGGSCFGGCAGGSCASCGGGCAGGCCGGSCAPAGRGFFRR